MFQTNKDLQTRLNAANDIIVCLEKKIAQLSESCGRQGDMAAMLQKLREGTCQELGRYKKEAGTCMLNFCHIWIYLDYLVWDRNVPYNRLVPYSNPMAVYCSSTLIVLSHNYHGIDALLENTIT